MKSLNLQVSQNISKWRTLKVHILEGYLDLTGHWHGGLNVCQWPGRPGFNPRSSHTKDSKNGTQKMVLKKWYRLAKHSAF